MAKWYSLTMDTAPLRAECEQEEDGCWLAEVVDLPGVLAYAQTREEALARAEALALHVFADRPLHARPHRAGHRVGA